MQDVTEAASRLEQVVFREALKQPRAKSRERVIVELLSIGHYLLTSPHSLSQPCVGINCILQMRNRPWKTHPVCLVANTKFISGSVWLSPNDGVQHTRCEVSCRCHQQRSHKNAASGATGEGIKPILEQVWASSSCVAMKMLVFQFVCGLAGIQINVTEKKRKAMNDVREKRQIYWQNLLENRKGSFN